MSLKVKEVCSLAIFNSLIGIDEGPDQIKSNQSNFIFSVKQIYIMKSDN